MTPPRLVLLRPRNAENLGAIARAMKNFGFTDWVVVSPNPELLEGPGTQRLAVKSGDVLESVRRADSLAEAVGDCTWVVGTTMRRIEGRARLAPRALAEQAAARGPERWALVFGDERHGLTNEDLGQCHALSFIPSSEAQPSLNLAQAVVVYAYELACGQNEPAAAPGAVLADDSTLRRVRAACAAALEGVGFLHSQGRHALDDLNATLVRSRLSAKEAGLWSAAFHVIAKRSGPATQPPR